MHLSPETLSRQTSLLSLPITYQFDETFNASPDLEELSNQRDKELVASLVEFCLNDCCNKRSLSMLIYKFAKYRKKLFFFIYPVN